ncbi:hypothetical protein [Erythrobacter sp. MTPC3]|uniref:hypothetical protein n=1 Tax=Erythrobacter sp. MTPC3 TaxID=3056564 RepID=UPI0036F2675E
MSVTALVAAAAMAGLPALSLSRGFEAYVDDRDAQQLVEFAAEAEVAIAQSPENHVRAALSLPPGKSAVDTTEPPRSGTIIGFSQDYG